ncbi:MAG: hypothetical protein ABI823_06635 [Bryobacteraceae bacterium]
MPYPETGTEQWKGGLADGAAKVANTADSLAEQAKEKASQFGRTAADKLEASKKGTADVLQSSADTLRNAGDASSEAVKGFAHKTASTFDSSAQYIRDHDFKGMMDDVTTVVKRNPTPSLLIALAVGFLAGASMRRSD